MKIKKVLTKLAVVSLSLLWLTPSYICAMDKGCPLLASISQSAPKKCATDCCQAEPSRQKHTAPCQTNSACGIQQNATTSQTFVLAPSLESHLVILLPVQSELLMGIRIATSKNVRSPSRGHPVQDFFSNSSNLSPPSLS